MIFKDEKRENNSSIEHLYSYHPYWYYGQNTDFISKMIMDIKCDDDEEWKVQRKSRAINFFCDEISKIITSGFVVCIVPSSKPQKLDTGIREIAKKLCKKNNLIDGTDCLVRVVEIETLHDGGNRDKNVHLNSIKVKNINIIKNREILLLDDVTSTGNSLKACKELLLKAGAKKVKCLAIGKTTYD